MVNFCVCLIVYFVCGLFLDTLITLHYRAISTGHAGWACALTFLITIVGMLLFDHFIDNQSVPCIITYALGTSLGTWIGMRHKYKNKRS